MYRPVLSLLGFFCTFPLVELTNVVRAQRNTLKQGTETLEEVMLGRQQHWVLIRGDSTANPILLFLHRGPGFAERPYAHIYTPRLTKHSIVVDSDQRGAGKSYSADVADAILNLEQSFSDTREPIQLLKKRFSKERIFFLGHSWGSILGLYMDRDTWAASTAAEWVALGCREAFYQLRRPLPQRNLHPHAVTPTLYRRNPGTDPRTRPLHVLRP